ncbi:hypothetical protein BBOV_III001130 [Babesia bovis T2Bo]|uniref:Uncharacterized protein n=1 Tax=Babesia bovis TaxID=5865 RepID=A7AM96_BABBO|nr:hypothetical protein BBOV_III001130 [Babesia bovis T2Bo]EDO07680.1 hypothetical protein BBOV_III001130 [Babesia bovis T2Bo]|eukprot:XP_001611248.1 hypothetical protein [Babesia bovis T2Bo]
MARTDLTTLLAGGTKRAWRSSIHRAKLDIFGSTKGAPGEEEWSKPLRGRTRNRWYWPSKYLHVDFSMKHYLAMQLRRLQAKGHHPSIQSLWDTVQLFHTKRNVIAAYLGNVDEDKRKKSGVLQDAQDLLDMITQNIDAAAQYTDGSATTNDATYEPFVKYALRRVDGGNQYDAETKLDKRDLKRMVETDPKIKEALIIRNRFADALYFRRRAYYLEKLARKKPVGETIQRYRKHFTVHPDHKDIWPDNKGISQHNWPSK